MAMMERNIFLDIIEKKIPAKIAYEDDDCLAFHDIHPQATLHVLIIPKKVIRTHAGIAEDDQAILGKLHWIAAKLAREAGYEHYRLTINCGEGAGQTVPHLHMHLLAGRQFGWPPG